MTIASFNTNQAYSDVLDAFQRDGCVLLEDLLAKQTIDQIATQIRGYFDKALFGEGHFVGFKTKRIGGLILKSARSVQMLAEPLVIKLVEDTLRPYCEHVQLNLTQGICIYPGERAQILHRDNGMFPTEGFKGEVMINVIWALDDIRPENGSTQLVPGSHKWAIDRQPAPDQINQVSMKKGSALVYLGSVIHGGGANVSDRPRPVAVFSYNLGWLRQGENQYLAIPPDQARFLPRHVQKLIGYTVHRPNLGLVECEDPVLLLTGTKNRKLRSRDYLTEQQMKMAEELIFAGEIR